MNFENDRFLFVKERIQIFIKQTKTKNIPINDIAVHKLFSLTNDVYKITISQTQELLYKIYQPIIAEFTDNELQTQLVLSRSNQQCYPQILQWTLKDRIQRFIPSIQITHETMTEERLIQLVEDIANFSCRFKEKIDNYNQIKGITMKYELSNLLALCRRIYKQKKIECPQIINKCQQQINQLLNDHKLLSQLQEILSKIPKVVSHNDCHLGNILINSQKQYLLDFQFSQFNYIGFDIGNFLNEWISIYSPSFQIDSKLQMSNQLKQKLYEAYFSRLIIKYGISQNKQVWKYYIQLGRVLSHLFWMIIGIKQINDPRINFCMVHYVVRRKEEFYLNYKILIEKH